MKAAKSRFKKDLDDMTKLKEAIEKDLDDVRTTSEDRELRFKQAQEAFESKLSELSISRSQFIEEGGSQFVEEGGSQFVEDEESQNLLQNRTFTVDSPIRSVVEDTPDMFSQVANDEVNGQVLTDDKSEQDSEVDASGSDVGSGDEENKDDIQSGSDQENKDDHQSGSEYIMDSSDEFEDENLKIGIYEIKNYLNPKDTIATDVDLPEQFKNKVFKPTPTALNNKLVFMAVGTGSTSHRGDKQGCKLSPACGMFWTKGDRIAKVLILAGNHPEVGEEVWSCFHHTQASVRGFKLQAQMIQQRHKAGSAKDYAPKENEGKKAEQLKKDVSDNEKGKSNVRSKEDSTGKAGGVMVAVHVRKRKTDAKK